VSHPEVALSEFVSGLAPASMPEAVVERVRLHILDAIACGFAGRDAEGRAAIAAVAGATFGPGRATVLAGDAMAAGGAVLLNGFQIAAPTLGDVHRETLTHVLPEVLPAALATAEACDASGEDLLAGIVAGMEATVRVARALDVLAYRDRAWHNPGIAGAIGAACGAARTRRLDGRGVRMAIGHAASQAAGTFVALGTSGVKVHQARGGLSGFLASELAAVGLDASDVAMSAARGGLLAAYADGGLPDRLTDGLGARYDLESVALRRWPVASSLQPVIEATLAIRAELGAAEGVRGRPRDVTSVLVQLPPRAFALNGAPGWETRLSALQSARWTVAVVLEDGEAWIHQSSDERRADGEVASFAGGSVTVAEDPSLPATGARVTAERRSGASVQRQVDVPPGDPQRPLALGDVRQKLDRAAADAGLGDRVPGIVDVVRNLGSRPARELIQLLGAR
jgi:2-methylcitrate dehydratase PrpD